MQCTSSKSEHAQVQRQKKKSNIKFIGTTSPPSYKVRVSGLQGWIPHQRDAVEQGGVFCRVSGTGASGRHAVDTQPNAARYFVHWNSAALVSATILSF